MRKLPHSIGSSPTLKRVASFHGAVHKLMLWSCNLISVSVVSSINTEHQWSRQGFLKTQIFPWIDLITSLELKLGISKGDRYRSKINKVEYSYWITLYFLLCKSLRDFFSSRNLSICLTCVSTNLKSLVPMILTICIEKKLCNLARQTQICKNSWNSTYYRDVKFVKLI